MLRSITAFAALLLCASGLRAAESVEGLAPYQPSQSVSGTLTIWGHGSYGAHTDFVEGLTRAWEEGFKQHQPGIQFDNRLHGTASAIGALYTGTGDLALMGREIWDPEVAAFREVKGYAPTGIDVMTGSFATRNKGYAIVFFVHRDNPISQLSLRQLDAAFSAERRRGGTRASTWGDLGATGSWANKPVNLYGMAIARGFADYVQEAVFEGAQIWNPEIREFADDPGSRGGDSDGGQKMLRAMANDPNALGYAGLLYDHAGLKPIAIAQDDGGVAVAPTEASVRDHRYPLSRVITLYVDHVPGQPLPPKVEEFLRYLLSREGQQAVIDHGGGYLPLTPELAKQQLQRLQPSARATSN